MSGSLGNVSSTLQFSFLKIGRLVVSPLQSEELAFSSLLVPVIVLTAPETKPVIFKFHSDVFENKAVK